MLSRGWIFARPIAPPAVYRNEAVDVRFNIANAQMQFVSTMSPVMNASGSGILRGNSFEMTVPELRR